MALYINEEVVTQALTINDAVALTEQAFLDYGNGKAFNIARERMRHKKGALHLLPAAIPYKNIMGYKAYTTSKYGAEFKFFLHAADTGEMLAVIDASEIGRLRTGAASAIATKYLAPKNADTMFMFGTGYQAEAQLQAIDITNKLDKIYIHSRRHENAITFVEKMNAYTNAELIACEDMAADLPKAQIITTITSSNTPLFTLNELTQTDVHINSAGGNSLIRAEIHEKVIEKADYIIVDNKDVAFKEAGDLLPLLEKGRLHTNSIIELSDIVAGFRNIQNDKPKISIFESQGMGLLDLYCAEFIYSHTVKYDLGIALPF